MITASERLGLRYCRPEDTAPIFNIYTGDPGSAKYLARQPHSGVEQTGRMPKKLSNSESLVANGMCVWVIEAISYGIAAGLIIVAKDDASRWLFTSASASHTEVAGSQQRLRRSPSNTCSQRVRRQALALSQTWKMLPLKALFEQNLPLCKLDAHIVRAYYKFIVPRED